jgi:hypothetical protein
MNRTLSLTITLCFALAAPLTNAQEHPAAAAPKDDPMASCPMHAQHMAAAQKESVPADGSAEHGADVDHRHDTFGMPHTESTHSFRLFADGGAIELRANQADDEETIAAIRGHLKQIAKQFASTDFSAPAFVHGYSPAGIADMTRLRAEFSYRYEQVPSGARIRITTKNVEALAAVHAFLRFQVTEHRTANTGTVEEDK